MFEPGQTFVDAANNHDLARCMALLAEDAEYRSTGVGTHDGKAAIQAMMASYFARYPDVHWAARNWRNAESGGTAFDFHMTGSGLDRHGAESIWFGADGLIKRIEVQDHAVAHGFS